MWWTERNWSRERKEGYREEEGFGRVAGGKRKEKGGSCVDREERDGKERIWEYWR